MDRHADQEVHAISQATAWYFPDGLSFRPALPAVANMASTDQPPRLCGEKRNGCDDLPSPRLMPALFRRSFDHLAVSFVPSIDQPDWFLIFE
jgi:hypothetical protein